MQADTNEADRPVFDVPNLLWFVGGSVAVSGCAALIGGIGLGTRGLWLLLAALAALAVLTWLSARLGASGWAVPSGVLAANSISFVVIAAVAFERLVGLLSNSGFSTPSVPATPLTAGTTASASSSPLTSFEWRWVLVVAAPLVAALLVYRRTQFPFVLAQVAFWIGVLLFSTVVPIVTSDPKAATFAAWAIVFGLCYLAAAIRLDLHDRRRQAFWFHFGGLVLLASGLAWEAADHPSVGWVLILLSGAIVLGGAAWLRRATWGLFGITGLLVPLEHYVSAWFGTIDAEAAITMIGFALVALGMVIRAKEESLSHLKPVWPIKRPPAG